MLFPLIIVNAQGSVLRVGRVSACRNVVSRLAGETTSTIRQWISIEYGSAGFANKAGRNDRTGEGGPLSCNRIDGPRINHFSCSKFADVAIAQRQTWHGRSLRISGSKPDPFLGPEEEEFLFLRVEVVRDIDRPAD